MMEFSTTALIRFTTALLAMTVLSACSLTTGNRLKAEKQPMPAAALAFQSDQAFGVGLSDDERQKLTAAEQQAFEFGRPGTPVTWKSDAPSVSGSIVVSQPFRVGQSSCLRFSHALINKKQSTQTSGTACRRDGGPWKLVK